MRNRPNWRHTAVSQRFKRSKAPPSRLARRRNDRAIAILPSTRCSQSPPARHICGIVWGFSPLVGSRTRAEPQDAGDNSRINLSLSPPCGFIAAAVNLAMVPPTQRHRELVTDLAPESRRLREAQMVSVRGVSPTDESGLLGNVPDVIAVPDAARLRQAYLPSGRFWNGSVTATSTGAKCRMLRDRIVSSCRRAVAAMAISAKLGE